MKWNRNIVAVILSALLCAACELPINWSHIFDSQSKEPFGTYVLKKELDSIFPLNSIEIIDNKTNEYFYPESDIFNLEAQNSEERGNYIYIHEEIILDSISQLAIRRFVAEGSAAFISSYEIPDKIPELKNIKIVKPFTNGDGIEKTKTSKKVLFSVQIPEVDSLPISYGNTMQGNYFTQIPENAEVIGTVTYQNETHPNFIKIPYEYGFFLLHAEPFAFTNFEMLRSNHANYVANVFSAMNHDTVFWDNHRMMERIRYGKQSGGFWNLFSFFMKQDALKVAIYLIFFGIIVFLLFNSSRRQKAIPMVGSYTNSQMEYAKVLTHLYSKELNHKSLLNFKINYVLDEIRKNYQLSTHDLNEKFMFALSQKSNISIEKCETLVRKLKHFQTKSFVSKEEFLDTSHILNQFLYLPKK